MKNIIKKITSLFNKKEGNRDLKKTTANLRSLKWLVVVLVLLVGIVTLMSPSKRQAAQRIHASDLRDKSQFNRITNAKHSESMAESEKYIDLTEEINKTDDFNNPLYKESHFSRKMNAQQVLQNNDSHAFKVPPGSLLRVALVNKLVTSTLNHPAIAVLTEDYYHQGVIAIEQGSRLLGRARHDEQSERVQIKFDTIVHPDESSARFSGVALDLHDLGSAGLTGEYHSRRGFRVAGSLLSHFTSGLASGLQDRSASLFGSNQEGSIKNGLLEGLSRASTNQADRLSNSLENVKGYVEIEANYEFLVYLDREFKIE